MLPLSPGLPSSPGRPGDPGSPARPSFPTGPGAPFGPVLPWGPWGPMSPLAPGIPGVPVTPITPGKPWNTKRHNENFQKTHLVVLIHEKPILTAGRRDKREIWQENGMGTSKNTTTTPEEGFFSKTKYQGNIFDRLGLAKKSACLTFSLTKFTSPRLVM